MSQTYQAIVGPDETPRSDHVVQIILMPIILRTLNLVHHTRLIIIITAVTVSTPWPIATVTTSTSRSIIISTARSIMVSSSGSTSHHPSTPGTVVMSSATRAVTAWVVRILAADHAWITTESDDFRFGVLASFRALRLEIDRGVLPLLTILTGVFNSCSQLWTLVRTAWAAWTAWTACGTLINI